jgi:hypothetical protein
MQNEMWRIRQNDELETIIKRENIVRFIKCQRIRWSGYVKRMQDTTIPRKDAVWKTMRQEEDQK